MAQQHDPHAIQLLVEEQVIGKLPEIGTPPAAGIEVKALGMGLNLAANMLEVRPEVVTKDIADRIIVADRGGDGSRR